MLISLARRVALVFALISCASASQPERIIEPLVRSTGGETSPGEVNHYLVASGSGRVFLRQIQFRKPRTTEGRNKLSGIVYIDPSDPTPKAVAIPGNSSGIDTLLATDPSGRWLVVQSHCRLDLASTSDCIEIEALESDYGYAYFLVDVQSGEARLITYQHDSPGDPVLWSRYGFITGAAMSDDGRYVYFSVPASGLVPDLAESYPAAYLYDRVTGQNRAIGLTPQQGATGSQATIVWTSSDGARAIFYDEVGQVWLFDRDTNSNAVISDQVSYGNTLAASRNGDFLVGCGRYSTNSGFHIELTRINVQTGEHHVVNPRPANSRPWIGCDFKSWVSNDGDTIIGTTGGELVEQGASYSTELLYRWKISSGQREQISHQPGDLAERYARSAGFVAANEDGNLVVFRTFRLENSPYGSVDAFESIHVRDMSRAEVRTVTTDHFQPGRSGYGRNGFLSADGSVVYFLSDERLTVAEDLNNDLDLYAYRVSDGVVYLVSRVPPTLPSAPNRDIQNAKISADGRWVAFESEADDLIEGQLPSANSGQVYLVSTEDQSVKLVTRRRHAPTRGATGVSKLVGLSDDGRFVAFTSNAANLDVPPTYIRLNSGVDTFVFDRFTEQTSLVTQKAGMPWQGVGGNEALAIDGSGRWILQEVRNPRSLFPALANSSSSDRALLLLPVTPSSAVEPVLVDRIHGTTLQGSNNVTEVLGFSRDLNSIVFRSRARNLTPDLLPIFLQEPQTFLFDRRSQRMHWITRSVTDPSKPALGRVTEKVFLTPDGQYMVLTHTGGDLANPVEPNAVRADCFRYSLVSGVLKRVVTTTDSTPVSTACRGISDNGRFVIYDEITESTSGENSYTIWRQDMLDGTRQRVNLWQTDLPITGSAYHGKISPDGQRVLFNTSDRIVRISPLHRYRNNVVIRDLANATSQLISDTDGAGLGPTGEFSGLVAATPDLSRIVLSSSDPTPQLGQTNELEVETLFLSSPARLSDNVGLSGLWGDPGVSGQGFHVINMPGRSEMLLSWYTYLPDTSVSTRTRQKWLLGLGQIRNGVARFEVSAADHGVFDSPGASAVRALGEITLRWFSCSRAEAHYSVVLDGKKLVGHIPLSRISPDTVCTAFEDQGAAAVDALPRPVGSPWQYGSGGAWHDPLAPGQGLLIEVLPQSNQVLASWFTFDAGSTNQSGRSPPTWLVATGPIQAGRAALSVFESTGGAFRVAGGSTLGEVGVLNLDMIDCEQMVASYNVRLGPVTRAGQIALERITPGVDCRLP